MALRRPPTTFSDEISAADLAANSVGASELADNAVDTAAIAANAVVTAKIADSTGAADGITTAKLATNAVTTAKITDANITTAKVADNAVTTAKVATATFTDNIEVKPHIIPGVLYPALKDGGGTVRQVDGVTAVVASTTGPAGSTVASSLYGTVQSDGRMYYYTDVKGSKPIKDPRIGTHFGSQRHKFKSIQKLEQETATHGEDVASVDGREWIRRVGKFSVHDANGANGVFPGHTATGDTTNSKYYEIVGYFNAANYLSYGAVTRDVNVFIDGTQNPGSTLTAGTAAHDTPLSNRYVDAGSVINIPITGLTTPGIHTLKIANVSGDYLLLFGIELVAQDLSGTGSPNREKIQIQPQNVVSYGKKFAVSSAAHHYNPFAYAQDGTTAVAIGNAGSHGKVTGGWSGTGATYYDSTLDTATSLGLAAWVDSGNYYRPINGGRIVKWIASDGTIKTSVNMMPPSAKAIGSHSGAATPHGTNWPATFIPVLSSGAADHTQAEIAKTFHVFEYGNGEANGNTSYRDMSRRGGSGAAGFQNIAYVMDDGQTAMAAQSCAEWNTVAGNVYSQAQKPFFYSFIGTGISLESGHPAGTVHNIAQNLPYGTHIIKIDTTSGHSTTTITLDGVQLNSSTTYLTYAAHGKLSFHQPKMPPIPEDAVVLADYMLLADFVKQTSVADTQISKGVRYSNGSRDHFYAGAAAPATNVSNHASNWTHRGLSGGSSPSGTGGNGVWRLPFFGTTGLSLHEDATQAHSIKLGGSATTETALQYSGNQGDAMSIAESVPLGLTEIETSLLQGSHHFYGHYVATPIHSSSHYQPFETPFLHELVGGDRNMEQNNLVVTADGKSWDEVTRDTSYMGNTVLNLNGSMLSSVHGTTVPVQWKLLRGKDDHQNHFIKENFVMAYNRIICLIAGEYIVSCATILGAGVSTIAFIHVNGTACTSLYTSNSPGSSYFRLRNELPLTLKEGDYIQVKGGHWDSGNLQHQQFSIVKVR